MIGRLNHVAIAVPDIVAAAALYRDVLGANVSAVEDQPEHGVQTVSSSCRTPRWNCWAFSATASPIRGFLDKNPAGGIHHICYEVDRHPGRPRPTDGRRRAGARRRPAQDRRPRQAGAVPASQGLQRRPGRARASMTPSTRRSLLILLVWWLVLFMVLPFGVRPADGRSRVTSRAHPPDRGCCSRSLITTILAGFATWGVDCGAERPHSGAAGRIGPGSVTFLHLRLSRPVTRRLPAVHEAISIRDRRPRPIWNACLGIQSRCQALVGRNPIEHR